LYTERPKAESGKGLTVGFELLNMKS
jgi:hypothetical protein